MSNDRFINLIKEISLDNKYTKCYISIVKKAQVRIDYSMPFYKQQAEYRKVGYFEKHHIVPDCFFLCSKRGSKKYAKLADNPDEITNLVLLSAREHLICHLLLTKMFEDQKKYQMYQAFWMLHSKRTNQDRITSRYYEKARLLVSAAMHQFNKDREFMPWSEKRRKAHQRNPCAATTRKPVLQFDLDGNVIQEFESGLDAIKKTNLSRAVLYNHVIDGSLPYNGFIYRYSDSKEIQNKKILNLNMLLKRHDENELIKSARAVKSISQYDLNRNLISKFRSVKDASRSDPNYNYATLWKAAKDNKEYKGYYWVFD